MKIKYIGDVHLGKKFTQGVPLHRRGEREALQWSQFVNYELRMPNVDLTVQVGDLFDAMYVPYSVVWAAATAYLDAPGPQLVLRGNHDASRDLDKISAFQIFAGLVRPHGVTVVDDVPVRIEDHVFIPWHPFITAEEMVEEHKEIIQGATVAVGHWDVTGSTTNLVPKKSLEALGIQEIVTGHDHTPRKIGNITVVGSMQPYSHGEDPNGRMYITCTLADLPDDVTNKCVRLILGPGEEVPTIDCLQLQVVREGEEGVEMEVDFEAFDIADLFRQAVEQVGLGDGMASIALQKLEEFRVAGT